MVPHFVHTIRGPNEGTVRSPVSDSTPFSRIFASVIGSIWLIAARQAITNRHQGRTMAGLSGFS
jgi:hypothetical protein